MMMVAEMGVKPRTLADDLFIFTHGAKHGSKMVKGMKVSRKLRSETKCPARSKSGKLPHELSSTVRLR